MKKFFVLFLSFIFIFSLCSCSEEKPSVVGENLDYRVSAEIESIEGVENLSDETIKALSIVVRTNLENDVEKNSAEFSSTLSDEQKERIKALTMYTSGLVLKDKTDNLETETNKTKNNHIGYFLSSDESFVWTKEIKKYELLSFLNSNGISLASLSTLSFECDEDGRVTEIILGGKSFPFKLFADHFNLVSDKLTNVTVDISKIIIEGVGYGKLDEFCLKEADVLSKSGLNYQEILAELSPKHFVAVTTL